MSETKSELLKLPVDCLEPIVALISAYDIGNMWLTGNFKLRKLLSEGGAARKLHFSYKPYFPYLWPRLIASLPHLVDIYIQDTKLSKFASFEPDLTLLPSSIRKLSLSYDGCFSAFKRRYEHDPTRFSSLQSLFFFDRSTQGEVSLDLRPLPNLTSFEVASAFSSNIEFSELVLPTYITKLQLRPSQSSLASLIESLPSTLESLAVTLPSQLAIWPLLPRGLLHLTIYYTQAVIVDLQEANLNSLPESLISLSIPVKTFTSAMAASLPRSLQTVCVYSLEKIPYESLPEIWASLPPNLERVNGSLSPGGLSPQVAEKIPRHWIMQMVFPISEPEILEKLPLKANSLLTKCDLRPLARFNRLNRLECSHFDLTYLKYLPASLEILEISHPAELNFSSSDIIQLPHNLKVLQARMSHIETSAWQYLPRGLTTIIFMNCFGELSPALAARQLPPTLTDMAVTELETTFDLLQGLPRSLTKLRVLVKTEKLLKFTPKQMEIGEQTEAMEEVEKTEVMEEEKQNAIWSHALPRFTNLSSIVIQADNCEFVDTKHLLQMLPRRLTYLHATAAKTDATDSDLQQHLPPGLSHLRLVSSPNITLSLARIPNGEVPNPSTLGLPPFLSYMTTSPTYSPYTFIDRL